MKIIFFGTPEFAANQLQALYEAPHIEILGVVSQKDKPAGRGKTLTPPPVKALAKKLNINIIQEENPKKLAKLLTPLEADFFVVIAYGQILPKEILDMPKYGSLNVHYSLLPKYRGASPMQEALRNGDTETGISIFKLDEKLDHGGIFLIRRVPIERNDNLETLRKKLSSLTSQILPVALQDIIDGELKPLPQNHKNATFCKKIDKKDGEIDLKKQTAEEIRNMVRAYTPWPGTSLTFRGKKIKILEAETSDESLQSGEFQADKNSLKIGTKSGTLLPTKIQLEGKKPSDIKSFLNGYLHFFQK